MERTPQEIIAVLEEIQMEINDLHKSGESKGQEESIEKAYKGVGDIMGALEEVA